MEAGRELDALVAERVMGWQVSYAEKRGRPPLQDDRWGRYGPVPHYSTEIAAAWQVVEQVQKMHDDTLAAFASFLDDGEGRSYLYNMKAADAALAICRAALHAVSE